MILGIDKQVYVRRKDWYFITDICKTFWWGGAHKTTSAPPLGSPRHFYLYAILLVAIIMSSDINHCHPLVAKQALRLRAADNSAEGRSKDKSGHNLNNGGKQGQHKVWWMVINASISWLLFQPFTQREQALLLKDLQTRCGGHHTRNSHWHTRCEGHHTKASSLTHKMRRSSHQGILTYKMWRSSHQDILTETQDVEVITLRHPHWHTRCGGHHRGILTDTQDVEVITPIHPHLQDVEVITPRHPHLQDVEVITPRHPHTHKMWRSSQRHPHRHTRCGGHHTKTSSLTHKMWRSSHHATKASSHTCTFYLWPHHHDWWPHHNDFCT